MNPDIRTKPVRQLHSVIRICYSDSVYTQDCVVRSRKPKRSTRYNNNDLQIFKIRNSTLANGNAMCIIKLPCGDVDLKF